MSPLSFIIANNKRSMEELTQAFVPPWFCMYLIKMLLRYVCFSFQDSELYISPIVSLKTQTLELCGSLVSRRECKTRLVSRTTLGDHS